MQLKLQVTGSRAIVYDADRVQQPGSDLFNPDYWQQAGAISGKAQGRGNALLLETPFGPAVLRHYLRGGFAARFSRERYLFLGYSRSRPIAEANMLARLEALGLPVPEVLGAICSRHGLVYTGALLTRRIPAATPLVDLLAARGEPGQLWIKIGACIRRFHSAGVYHADLNVRNILVDGQQRVWLIDFDRARMLDANHKDLAGNLERLKRSLHKANVLTLPHLENCWNDLMMGYRGVGYNNGHDQVDIQDVEKKA